MKISLLCLSALICFPLAAQATMYKCTQPDGKSTFQDTPCPGGTVGTVANVNSVQTVSQSVSDDYVGPPVPVAVGGGVYSSGTDTTYATQHNVVIWRDRALAHREAELHRQQEAARRAEQQRSAPLPSSSNNTARANTSTARAPTVHAAAHAAAHR